MKYLIVGGDSNTDQYFDSISNPNMDFNYPKWPELLGDKLDMKVINVARSGQGNEYIYTTLRNEIIKIKDKSEIGLVLATWTQAPRRDFKNEISTNHQPWSSLRFDTHGNLPFWVERTLGHMLNFQILCERYDVPYAHFQMIEMYEHFLAGHWPSQNDIHYGADPRVRATYPGDEKKDKKVIFNMFIEYEAKLDTSKFMGWPPVKELGGWRFKDQLDIWKIKESPRRVSELDNHPNALGHIAMCDKINMLLQEYNIIGKNNG